MSDCADGSARKFRRFPAWSVVVLAALLLAGETAQATLSTPLEFRQRDTFYNYQSVRGVPISATVDDLIGSDGRMPLENDSAGAGNNYPLVSQFEFRSFIAFGGSVNRTNWLLAAASPLLQGENPFSASVASAMQLPMALTNGSPVMILRQAQVGAPYIARKVDYMFGSVIGVPATGEDGTPLAVVKETYWQAEPYVSPDETNTTYYFSPHARKVFAIQAGAISVTWRKLAPYTAATKPSDYHNPAGPDFETNGVNVYLLYTVRYLVSSSPVKPPLKMYWTEREYRVSGVSVSVPKGRVGGINIAYNNEFPRTVSEEYHGPGYTSPTEGSTNASLQELRTLWYDQSQGMIYAYNKEGRAFVELLGDANPDGLTRQHLGYEIVDVFKQPTPADIVVELGERLVPPAPESADDLYAEPVLTVDGEYVYRHTQAVTGRLNLYATRETHSLNDCLVHWLEAGVAGIKWPKCFARYQQIWPDDVGKYSHYIRPEVASEDEAKETAVQLSTDNVPFIAFQDPLDRPRAKLTEDYKFYTYLDKSEPAHRTLLRFISGENVAFERVFSWLDGSLSSMDLAGSVATNLTVIDNIANYAAKYADYTNRLAAAWADYAPRYLAYTNYLAASSLYDLQLAAYRDYESANGAYLQAVAAYAAYTNWQSKQADYANYIAASNTWQTQFTAYTNYLNGLTRGVNRTWTLVANDWWDNGTDGTLGTWGIQVVSSNVITKLLVTNEFTSASVGRFAAGAGAVSAINVSGIANPVLLVRIKLNSLSHASAFDMHFYVNSSPTRGISLFDYPCRSGVAVSGINVVFDDQAAAAAPYYSSSFLSGSYRPYSGTINSLLDTNYPYAADPGSPPSPVDAPGTQPAYAVDPGPPPATVAYPGTRPAVVLEPSPPDIGQPPSTNLWSDPSIGPRVVSETAYVGDRINAPQGELGGDGYLAGHINSSKGTLYHPEAYLDPLSVGFDAANLGAIIPVNAIPGSNTLEVWWFRTNTINAGPNAGNTRLKFATIYWPSVLGHYTLQWPENPREIVLASKLGSGTLNTFETQGSIYRQPNPSLPGYNPNEEHAIMSGGMAFATRDDLNLTDATNYSSAPFVLLQYTAQDGRPAVTAFRVLREKPSEGYVFDYIVPAGQLLQPPPPLTFLQKPVEGSGDYAVNYNTERSQDGGDLPGGWSGAFETNRVYSHYKRFTWRDRHNDFWVYRGPHSGQPALEVGAYDAQARQFQPPLGSATATVGQPFRYSLHASRQQEYLTLIVTNLPAWLSVDGLSLAGSPQDSDVGSVSLTLVVRDLYDQSSVTNFLALAVSAEGEVVTQDPLLLYSTNSDTGVVAVFSNRPPVLAVSPTPGNSFTMRYYYKTEDSFDWPGIATPPPTGTIVPYLRPINTNGVFVGNGAMRDTKSLAIVYRPVWPVRDPKDSAKPLPSLPFGATLTTPKWNLPGVRDMLTAQVLYQQSIASNIIDAVPSVVLHDGTRQKVSSLDAQKLSALPAGVVSDVYLGKYYFPNLAPHLSGRIYYDPTAGSKGSLVFNGQYVKETVGESYLLLNVLRGSDLAAVKGLCPTGDSDKAAWDALVDALSTDVETFIQDPNAPGRYLPDTKQTASVGVGDLAEITSGNSAVDSYALSAVGPGSGYVTLIEADGTAFTKPGDPVAMHVFKTDGSQLYTGEIKVIPASNPLSELVTFQHTADVAGHFDEYEYEWRIGAPVDGVPPVSDDTMSAYTTLAIGTNLPMRTLGGAGIQALSDNYVVMRYRAKSPDHPLYNQWSSWTEPKLAEGWIKRVLAGINPFNQRTTDLFNNQVNTDASILTQAGKRWEGDVALNSETINNYGLIEIYETVLRRGRMLSIESGYNYGPANDALLLAASYLNDLYMMEGGEAWADASNPTIGIGTKDKTYGDIATSLFAFKGQTASLLEEELALLRGRDDSLMPGVQTAPVYNRLVWNYTRGIDSGEVIYALNYDIQPSPDNNSGSISASDAAYMYPQGHGDAYGHYLTALKGYYSLIMNSKFDWVPRAEAVNVLGMPVSVDYQDERKFAASAAAVARTGRQIFDLTWRKDYASVHDSGWSVFGATRSNASRTYESVGTTNAVTRYWSMDHWATRTGQGAFINWVVGNSILPDHDMSPLHEGIQKIDRTTVPELNELALTAAGLQTALDNAEGGLSPLGVPEGGIAFDINPTSVGGASNGSHFEQIYQRAITALNNAVASFNDAKDVTRLMRSEQDSLTDFQASVNKQEQAYKNSLVELYGTPYPEDIGAGKTFKQGYDGPDIVHYMYADLPEKDWLGDGTGTASNTFIIDIQKLPTDWLTRNYMDLDFVVLQNNKIYTNSQYHMEYTLGSHGFYDKPEAWTGVRNSPGKIQQAISEMIAAHDRLWKALDDAQGGKEDLDKAIRMLKADIQTHDQLRDYEKSLLISEQTLASVEHAFELYDVITEHTKQTIEMSFTTAKDALPSSFIAGLAAGGDLTAPARAAMETAGVTINEVTDWSKVLSYIGVSAFSFANDTAARWTDFDKIAPLEWQQELRGRVAELGQTMNDLNDLAIAVNRYIRSYDDAQRKYRALIAEGDRMQQERQIFRQRAATVIQGYRTRDAAFRLFRNEKLERYKTLFDLASRYSLLAANAYDYDTGLLGTTAGRDFKRRIINTRALGVIQDGQPQYAGSDTGDPGLSSALAEMKADWDVLRGRLGFNSPDAYGTTVSLRTEKMRILPTSDGDSAWKDALQAGRQRNILDDVDVRRYCMQIDDGSGLPVPGIILTFSTTIADGYNLFGRELAAGDHAFTPSSFATKIFGAGVAFVGYRGMDDPAANGSAVSGSGSSSPTDPGSWYLDPLALSATPYIYLIPVGVDSMRSPPLGDTSTIRTWNIEDVAIPMPFNIGESDFSTKQLWQSSDSLTEPLFTVRKHQAFRPVSTTSVFSSSLYGQAGTLQRSQFTNNRLAGRSVWNSQWKLVIPGKTLLANPSEGLDRFIQTVTDIKLHFDTYSYSGN